MNYRLNYQLCPLHEEPLNYICLHSNCHLHRVICAICREQRHAQSHHTLPLKLYLSRKLNKLRCLTQSDLQLIEDSLQTQKLASIQALDQLTEQVLLRIGQTKVQFEQFYEEQLVSLQECMGLINNEEINVEKLQVIELAARAANSHEEYLNTTQENLQAVSSQMLKQLEALSPQQLLMEQYWVGHSEIEVNSSILTSNTNDYKIAYLSKPISKNCKANFKIIKNTSNWIAVGICHSQVVQERNFGFRYHTIGHGVYAISSNGGIWSHFRPDFNNKLGGPQFSQSENVTVGFDGNSKQVSFKAESGQKLSLDVDGDEKGTLHFCVLFYFEGDEIELISDLS